MEGGNRHCAADSFGGLTTGRIVKALIFERNGEPADVLAIRELPNPAPGLGEVLVRVAKLIPSDTKVLRSDVAEFSDQLDDDPRLPRETTGAPSSEYQPLLAATPERCFPIPFSIRQRLRAPFLPPSGIPAHG
jgi:hypothetical protein